MLKHLTVPVLGLAVMAAATVPASADRGRAYWVNPTPTYTYEVVPQKKVAKAQRQQKRKFDPKLDFETEAVWRNLRPEWFD
jgi:hypothetical protein